MTRFRLVDEMAGMFVIKLTPQDIKDLDLKPGIDLVDIEDAVKKTSISKVMKKELKIK